MFFHFLSKFLERKAWKAMKRSKTYFNALRNSAARISCVIGTRIDSRTLIKWRIFIDAKLNLTKNDYFPLKEHGDSPPPPV